MVEKLKNHFQNPNLHIENKILNSQNDKNHLQN